MKTIVRKFLPRTCIDLAKGLQTNVVLAFNAASRRKKLFTNREGFLNYNFLLHGGNLRNGVSALLRVRNEEDRIYHCIKSIYDSFDGIIYVDNASDDRTMEIVQQLKGQIDKRDKIRIYYYPFSIARYGTAHFHTPEDSVSSFVYYNNWSLSKCSRRWVCKWDGDMILRREAREALRDFFIRIQNRVDAWWELVGETVYRDLEGNYLGSPQEINAEIRLFPYSYNTRFIKIDLYEMLASSLRLETSRYDEVAFYELKFADQDEFSHWSDGESHQTPRKEVDQRGR